MQLGSSVRSGQTSFYCRANQCSAEEGRELKRGWLSSHSGCCISLSQEDGDEIWHADCSNIQDCTFNVQE